jgi:hypothetical protein
MLECGPDFFTFSIYLAGNIDIPLGTNLYKWVWKLRKDYMDLQDGKQVHLKLEHVVALTSLGVTMTFARSRHKTLQEKVDDYVAFVKKHGRQPHQHSKDDEEGRLGRLAIAWRQMYKKAEQGITKHPKLGHCVIPQELIDVLTEVGFRWKSKDFKNPRVLDNATWDEKFERLKDYKEKHGHCEPPIRHPTLGSFVFEQRRQYKYMNAGLKSNLTLERFRKLSELGSRFKVAEKGHPRTRYSLDGSSGYGSSASEHDDFGEDVQEHSRHHVAGRPTNVAAYHDHFAHDPTGTRNQPNGDVSPMRWPAGPKSPRYSGQF